MALSTSMDMDVFVMSIKQSSGRKMDKALGDLFYAFNSTILNTIRRYPTFDKDDLESVAKTALWQSIDKFDPSKGSFSNYAVKNIMTAVANEISSDNGLIHIPDEVRSNIRKVNKAKEILKKSGIKNAEVEDIMHISGMERKTVEWAMLTSATVQNTASLDTPLQSAEDDTLCLGDTVMACEEEAYLDSSSELKKDLEKALEALPEKERKIYSMRMGFNGKSATNKEIMKALGISEPTVIKYFKEAEKKVREALSDWNPKNL